MFDKKLQLKSGQTMALVNAPGSAVPHVALAPMSRADAFLIFVVNKLQLEQNLQTLQNAAAQGKLLWLAYPKAKQLNTDLNRDTIRSVMNENGLDPVRQIAIDGTWSALRLKLHA